MDANREVVEKLAFLLGRFSFRLFQKYFELLEAILRLITPSYKRPAILDKIIQSETESTLDERIRKIDTARENLQDAISAIDELRTQADANKAELEDALRRISEVERQKQELNTELDALRQVADVDTAAFRRVVGLPTKGDLWRDRLLGFVSGVLASFIASLIFVSLQIFVFRPHK